MVVKKKATSKQQQPVALEPPQGMPEGPALVWRQIVASNDLAGRADGAALEAFCTLVSRMRDARARVDAEGLIVKDARGQTVPHPALAVERQTAEEIRAWGDRFAALVKPIRRRGYMADATAVAIAAAPRLADRRFAGAVGLVRTLAWMIDEAQRAGMEQLQKAPDKLMPLYLRTCAELQITPASVPVVKPAATENKGASGGGSVSDLQEAAQRRRRRP